MRPDSIWARRLRILTAAVGAAAGFSSSAYSSVTLDASSTAKITHDSDISPTGSAPSSHKNVDALPDSGSIYPVNKNYSYGPNTLTYTVGKNTATSTAQGSIGAVTNSVNCGFTLANGTGVTQDDPSGKVFGGDAELKFDVKGVWDVGSGGYGGGAYGYMSFTLGSTIPSGGSAEVDIDMTWTDGGTHSYRGAYHLAQGITSTSTPISTSAKLDSGSSIASGKKIVVAGTITLLVRDPCGPVTISPADFEASSTPAIWKFSPPLGSASLNFGNAANWIDVMGAANEPSPVPNQPGARALFQGSGTLAAPVIVTQTATLGMLDIDQQGVNFSSSGAPLVFDTLGSNAVLAARIDHDTTLAGHTISVPLVLNKTLEIDNDAAGAIVLTQPVTGSGGIEKNGAGEVIMNSTGNAFVGPLNINQGALTVNGALPNGGVVNVNAGGALAGAGNGTTTGRLGNVTLNGGSIHPGNKSADGSVGTLTMNSLNVTSGNLRPDLFSQVVADRVNVTGAATISGPLAITPIISNLQSFSAGTYTLLSAGALNLLPGGTPILQGVPTTSRFTFTLDTASVPNSILLDVIGSAPKAIRWTGGSTSNWDVNTSQNWLDLSSNPEHYFDFDSVSFDDTAINSNVILDAQISPNSVAFLNSSQNYSLISSTGTGGITGSGGLTKSGSGSLLMGVSNSYSGATQVMSGTLTLGSAAALSPNSTVVLGSDTSAAAIDLNGFSPTIPGLLSAGSGNNKIITNSSPASATLNFAGGSSSFGGLIQDGSAPVSLHVLAGTLILTGSNTNSGPTVIDNVSQDNGDLPGGIVASGVATLQVGNGGTSGNLGTGDVQNNGALVFNRSDAIVVANNISGSGQVIKSGSGTLVLAGNNSFSGGLDVTGGALSFSTDSNLGDPKAPVTLDGGRLNIPSGFTSTRAVYLGMAGGTIDTGTTNTTFDNVSGCGTLTKLGVAALTVNSLAAEVLNLNSGRIVIPLGRDPVLKHSYVETLSIVAGATLDLGDNDLILDYDHNGVPDPAKQTQIKNLIAMGYNFGSWDGPGITSTAAMQNGSPFITALGYAEASATGLKSFDGMPTDGDMVLVRYTLAGDANLDGRVNALDFNALAANYGMMGGTWPRGDFDYSSVVDTNDFVLLAQNFGHSLLPGPALGDVVPEPSVLCLLLAGLIRTRRRRISANK